MRPPHFGQDITNTTPQNNNSGDENGEDESNNRSRQEYIISRLTQNGATPVAHIAGKGIIRVVSRCEDAKENNNLGEHCASSTRSFIFIAATVKFFVVVKVKSKFSSRLELQLKSYGNL